MTGDDNSDTPAGPVSDTTVSWLFGMTGRRIRLASEVVPSGWRTLCHRETSLRIPDMCVDAVIDTINPLLERMSERKNGSVAIISSLSAYHGLPTFPAYAASKSAVKAYYEAVRGLYKKLNITISIVCPSYINTDMTASLKVSSLLIMDVDAAVNNIQSGIAKRKPVISFPWYHSLGIQLLRLLPARMGDWILLTFLGK